MRCEWCRDWHPPGSTLGAAHRRYVKTRDNGGVAPVAKHNYATYVNWHCGCEDCRAANAAQSRKHYRRRVGTNG